jgi:two-component system, chemotaxis family, response regulator Rcp1
MTEIALQDGKNPIRLHVARDDMEAMEFLHREAQMPDLNLPRKDDREVLTTSNAQRDIMQTYNMHANCCIVKRRRRTRAAELRHCR